MSTKRTISLRDKKKRKRGYCTWCEVAVKKPRIYWCSDECVLAYRLRSDGSFLRSKVFERDQGICAACGLDTEALKAAYVQAARAAVEGVEERMEALGFKVNGPGLWSRPDHLWENNHIIPVCKGGGASWDTTINILDNCETLCLNCHKEHTRNIKK